MRDFRELQFQPGATLGISTWCVLLGYVMQGAKSIAGACWSEATSLLLSAAPLSPDDCLLWVELMQLLQALLLHSPPSAQDLLLLTDRLAAGSGWKWMAGRSSSPPAISEEVAAQEMLLPELLHTVSAMVMRGSQICSPAFQTELWEELQVGRWLSTLAHEQGGYGCRLAALQLLATLTRATQHAALEDALSAEMVLALTPLLRGVLMKKEQWSRERWCGKAAALAAGRAVAAILQTAPQADWCRALGEIGSTYWLSCLVRDQCVAAREVGFQILAALASAARTMSLLQEAWPESGSLAAKAAMKADEVSAVRTAAMGVVAAVLAHRPEQQDGGISGGAGAAGKQRLGRHTLSAEYMLSSAGLATALQAVIEVCWCAELELQSPCSDLLLTWPSPALPGCRAAARRRHCSTRQPTAFSRSR